MKRLAILIQSPLSGIDYRPGVCVDITRWIRFLMSLPGGAWTENEILVLNNPTKLQLRTSLIRAKYSDFSIVVFSGHGFVQKDEFLGDDETYLYLKTGKLYDFSEHYVDYMTSNNAYALYTPDIYDPAKFSKSFFVKIG